MLRDSNDSLGTRSLPALNQSFPSLSVSSTTAELRKSASGRVSGYEKLPVSLFDVQFFDDDEDDGNQEFQCTLAIIKPEVVQLMYKVECIMAQNGFIIKTKEVLRLSRDQAAEFYDEQALAPYFTKLVDHMSGAPIVVYVLSKKNCVEEWLRLIGPANVSRAKCLFPVSLRAIYGTEQGPDPVANAFHGSGSAAEAVREIKFFFPNSKVDSTTNGGYVGYDEVVYRQYIKDIMIPTISEGLSKMFNILPQDPLRWLGNWLLTRDK